MENQNKGSKKLWKPPSVEDFNVESQCKRIKLDQFDLEKVKEEVGVVKISEPKTIDELATHPKKIEEIKNWFHGATSQKSPILLITGPAGSAKTVTLKVVTSSLNVSLQEWVNPMDKTDFKTECFPVDKSDFTESRQIDKFEEFIFRASRYKSLFDSNDKTAILVEDFPNIFIWKPRLFYDFLENYQANGRSPIVFICTDDQNLNLSNDLFPNSIKTKYNITEIKFNPVNHSSLMKTLKKVVGKCSDKQSLSPDVLQSIAQTSNGDLRNALSNLEILLASSKQRRAKKTIRSREKSSSQASAEAVSLKDNKAEFYQALGRVLYPKTIKKWGKAEDRLENENRIFIHDVIEISNSFSDSFLMLLHENYISTFSDVKSVTEAANIFSVCDLFQKETDLTDYTSLIGVTGLMLSNKEPKREGFKPIKKSGAPYTGGSKDVWTKRFEYSNFNETCRVLSLDIIPYLKLINTHGTSKSNRKSEEDDGEDDFEIEEFDD